MQMSSSRRKSILAVFTLFVFFFFKRPAPPQPPPSPPPPPPPLPPAVPAGVLICGFLGPAMAVALGWRGAMLATAAACVAGAAMLQPLRARFDDDRVPSRRFRL